MAALKWLLIGFVAASLASARAQTPPLTTDLVAFSGGSAQAGFQEVTVGGDAAHVQLGVLLWVGRQSQSQAPPMTVTLSGRGLGNLLFFEPAPLRETGVDTAPALRLLLALPAGAELPPADDPSLAPDAAAWRRVVREAMRAFNVDTLDKMADLAACQRRVPLQALESAAGLRSLLACVPGFKADRGTGDGPLVRFLHQQAMLHPVLHSQVLAAPRMHVAGYLLSVESTPPTMAMAEIHASAGDARAEKILSLTSTAEPGLLQHDAVKLFAPPLFTVLGIAFGAWLGFKYFRRQQWVQYRYFRQQQQVQFSYFNRQQDELARRQESDRFHQRKYEERDVLLEFFKAGGVYDTITHDKTVSMDDIFKRIRAHESYSILPARVAAALTALDTAGGAREDQLAGLDALMRQEFGEYMN